MWPECNRISLHSTRSGDLGSVKIRELNFVISGAKFTKSCLSNLGHYLLVDISIRSTDIHDQNLKLSRIMSNFGRFLPSQILGVQNCRPPKVVPKFSYLPCGMCFVRLLPLASKLLTLIR